MDQPSYVISYRRWSSKRPSSSGGVVFRRSSKIPVSSVLLRKSSHFQSSFPLSYPSTVSRSYVLRGSFRKHPHYIPVNLWTPNSDPFLWRPFGTKEQNNPTQEQGKRCRDKGRGWVDETSLRLLCLCFSPNSNFLKMKDKKRLSLGSPNANFFKMKHNKKTLLGFHYKEFLHYFLDNKL